MGVKDIRDFLQRNSERYYTIDEIAQELSLSNSNVNKQMMELRATANDLDYRCRVVVSSRRRGSYPQEYSIV